MKTLTWITGLITYLFLRSRGKLHTPVENVPPLENNTPAHSNGNSGGMKMGPDTREINLDTRFGEKHERDIVDQAGWESFPASDPPAY